MATGPVRLRVVAGQVVTQPKIGLRLVPRRVEVIQRLVRLLHRAERPFHLAFRPRCDAPPVRAAWHVGAHLHPELRHHPPKDARLRDRAVVEVEHPRDALQHQARLVLGRHRVEQEAQRGGDVLAVNAAVLLINDTAAVIDGAEQHQGRLPAASLDPERRRHLLEVRRRQVELPALVDVLGLEPLRRRRPAHALVVQPPRAQVSVHRGAGQQPGRRPDQAVRRLDPVLDQQLDGADGREMPVLPVGGAQLHGRDQLAEPLHLAFRQLARPAPVTPV